MPTPDGSLMEYRFYLCERGGRTYSVRQTRRSTYAFAKSNRITTNTVV